jgi:GH24 family phage-related lysozyme (muramidase)
VRYGSLGLTQAFESYSSSPYLCPAGVWTIGWGATRGLDGRAVTAQTPPVSRDEALVLLLREITSCERAVNRLISVPLTQGRFDALVDFTFNLGAGALQRSTLRQVVNREDHAAAPDEFLKWYKAGGRILPGLLRRRRAEVVLYVS